MRERERENQEKRHRIGFCRDSRQSKEDVKGNRIPTRGINSS